MTNTRWLKLWRDLLLNRGRTLLVVAAIAIGVAAVGSILSALSVGTREMDRNFASTNPASAVLHMREADEQLVQWARSRPAVRKAEARREVLVRLIGESDEWISMRLVVVHDFEDVDVSRMFAEPPERHIQGPGSDGILIERSSLDEVPIALGDDLSIALPGQQSIALSVVGLVHDPGRTPAWMTGVLVGYVTPAGLARLGVEPALTELRVVFVDAADRSTNLLQATELRNALFEDGYEVLSIDVPEPGEHPAEGVMTTMLFLLQAFGVLTLLSSGALVATLISAQMNQQRREIGLMKAMGASSGQIAAIYLGTVAVLSIVALVIGIPLGLLGGRGFIVFVFGLLNFEVESFWPAWWVLVVQVGAGLIVPLAAVAYPVIRNGARSVRALLDVDGRSERTEVADDTKGISLTTRLKTVVRPLGLRMRRPARLGIRNAFRNRERTGLTVVAIAIGGSAFMVALNTGVAWDRAVDAEFDARRYALEVGLDQPYAAEAVRSALTGVAGLGRVEVWTEHKVGISALGSGSRTDGAQSLLGSTASTVRLFVPTSGTEMIDYPLLDGRWLRAGDRNALVVSQVVADALVTVGDEVVLETMGTTSIWKIVGVVRQLSGGQSGVAYASSPLLSPGAVDLSTVEFGNHIRIEGSDLSVRSIEAALTDEGIGVWNISTAESGREALDDHLLIIVGLLMIMAIMIAVVGGLGLIEAMSINVLERRRELAVIRAVGATNGKVLQVVVAEGVVLAIMSWFVAVGLSIPATLLVENVTGTLFTQAPLATGFSVGGVAIWLVIVVALASVASAIPALEVVETPVHRSLAYE